MLSKRLSAFCAVALGCAPLFSMAANFNVNNPTEFQTALTTAQANGENDTINVAAGTYNVGQWNANLHSCRQRKFRVDHNRRQLKPS